MPRRSESEEERRKRAREVALALYLLLRRREKRTAAALLKAEGRTLRALKVVAVGVAAHAVASLARAGADTEAAAHSAIRHTTPLLAAAIERELVAQRQRARIVSRSELQGLGPGLHAKGAYEIDAAASHVTAGSYATAWGQRAIANVARVDYGGPYRTTAQAVGEVVAESEGRLRRIAATETAHAFNDERERIFDDYGDKPGAFKVWSAVLDRRTCSECWGLDGKVIRIHESFGGDPPRHPFCRCVVVPLIVPKPQRLEDTAIDYDLFKQEMRDVIREGRERSDRHAARFVQDSQTDRTKFGRPARSSTVLVEKYARGDYEQAKRPQIHSKVRP